MQNLCDEKEKSVFKLRKITMNGGIHHVNEPDNCTITMLTQTHLWIQEQLDLQKTLLEKLENTL